MHRFGVFRANVGQKSAIWGENRPARGYYLGSVEIQCGQIDSLITCALAQPFV